MSKYLIHYDLTYLKILSMLEAEVISWEVAPAKQQIITFQAAQNLANNSKLFFGFVLTNRNTILYPRLTGILVTTFLDIGSYFIFQRLEDGMVISVHRDVSFQYIKPTGVSNYINSFIL